MKPKIYVVLFLCDFLNLAIALSLILEKSYIDVKQDEPILFDTLEDLCEFVINLKNVSAKCCYSLTVKGSTHNLINENVNSCYDRDWIENDLIKTITIVNSTVEILPTPLLAMRNLKDLRVKQVLGMHLKLLLSASFLESLEYLSFEGALKTEVLNDNWHLLQMMPSLVSFRISHTNITTINLNIFHLNKNLTKLKISDNNLASLTFSTDFLNQLKELNISGNNISAIEVERRRLGVHGNLKMADLRRNILSFLPELFCSSFSSTAFVYLEDNPWDKESCNFYHLWEVIFTNENAHIGFQESKPNLRSCDWSTCPAECTCYPDRRMVNCSSRGLIRIPDVGPSETETLILSNNSLGGDILRWMKNQVAWCNLKSLFLDSNNFSSIFDSKRDAYGSCECIETNGDNNCMLPYLRDLSLASNDISGFSKQEWRFIRRMETLNLSRNRVQRLRFAGESQHRDFSTLANLDLSHNSLVAFTELDVILFPYLNQVNLSHNQLKKLNISVISFLPELNTLDLSFNRLEKLIFPNLNVVDPYSRNSILPNLENLYLHQNQLQYMISPIWRTLKELSLYGNPWKCSSPNNIRTMMDLHWKNPQGNIARSIKAWKCYHPDIPLQAEEVKEEVRIIPQTSTMEPNLFIVILITVLFLAIVILSAGPIKRLYIKLSRVIRDPIRTQFQGGIIEYDVFIFQSDDDETYTRENIVPELEDEGYKVAFPGRDYPIHDYETGHFFNLLSKSRKMLVVVSRHFFSHRYLWVFNQALTEERYRENFKIRAFLLRPYVEEADCPNVLIHRIIFVRGHIRSQSLLRLDELKHFLGPPMIYEQSTAPPAMICPPQSAEDRENAVLAEDEENLPRDNADYVNPAFYKGETPL